MSIPEFEYPSETPYQEALEQTRLALAETDALYHVARSLIGFADLPGFLQVVVDSVAEAIPANRVILITFDLEARQVTHFVKGGPGIQYVTEVSFEELWDGLSGWTLRQLKPALSLNGILDARESLEVQQRRTKTNAGSIIVVPVRYQDNILGTMTAINCTEEREFHQRDVELMMALASQTAIAIENVRLYNELQKTNAELERRVAERTVELTETNTRLQREVAERKRAAQALQASEERYRLLVENMNDGLAVVDENLKFTYTNRRFSDLLGFTSDELIGQPWDLYLDTSNREIGDEHVAKRRKGEQSLYQLDWTRKDGHRISTLVSGTPLLGDHGEFLGSFAVVTDITEQKRTEEALRQREVHTRAFQEKLKALQETSLELSAVESFEHLCRRAIELGLSDLGYDRIGLLLFENADKSRISRFGIESTGELRVDHGISYKPAADRVYTHLHNREDAFVSEDADLGDFENIVGRGWNVVVGIWDASASIGWLAADNLFKKQPLIPYQVELLKLYGLTLGHLVTRKRAEVELQRYNQRLSTLHDIDRSILVASSLESIADIVLKHLAQLIPCEFASVILHNDEITEEQVFAWHHAPDVHVLTKTIQPVVPNAVLERLKSGQSAVTADLRTQEGQLALLAEDLVAQGVYSAMANPMMVQGRLIGTLALASRQIGFFTLEHQQIAEEVADQVAIAFHQAKLHDQIELHNLELEQRVRERTTQLENANRELELFSYSVSHDLRAPLRAIQGFAEIIARRHRRDLSEEGRRYFDNIVTASEQMNQLITNLLDYARLGRQRMRLEAIPVSSILREAIDNLTPRIEKTDAQLHIDHKLPIVLGDKTLLKQIFTNLLENALVYHRPGIFPVVQVSCSLEAGYALIRITDNGIGIPAEFHEKIFNIFQRLHSPDQYPGTGIGLAIVRRSAQLLNGTVLVESGNTEGSTFCVRLPCPTQ